MHKKYIVLLFGLITYITLPQPIMGTNKPVASPSSPEFSSTQKTSQAHPEFDLQDELKRATILLQLGNPNESSSLLKKIIAQDPENLLAHQKLRRALIQGQQARELPEALAELIPLLLKKGHRDAAIARFNELKVLAPYSHQLKELEYSLKLIRKSKELAPKTSLATRMRSLIGIFVLLGCAFLLSANRSKIDYRLVRWGMSLQLIFAILILWSPPGKWFFNAIKSVIQTILSFTDAGASFLFGNLYNGLTSIGSDGPIQVINGSSGDYTNLGLIFAFHILPTVIFFGSLMAVLYHLGFIQRLVTILAWIMTKTMRSSGAESLSAASNIFVGQTEAPLVIRPFLDKMTQSELMTVMVGGFATVAGGVLAAYSRFGIDPGHLLAASVMSAPAALAVAKILYPEMDTPNTAGTTISIPKAQTANVIDAATTGATDGLKLALNVAAMLIAFIALISMLNWAIGGIGSILSIEGLSLKKIFGVIFYPLSWCMGVEAKDLFHFGNLLGTKITINEFVAFVELGHLKNEMSPRTVSIATYALCGFSNFASIGIQIGGIGSVSPSRRQDLAIIGLKAMIGGAIASWLTACIAALLL